MAIKRFSDKQRRQHKQRVMLVASLLFFFATTGFNLTNFFKQVQSTPAAPEQAATDPLQQEAQGYEIVLQREPNNQAALEGLVNTRLQMNDAAGAIKPLEKLVQLHPDRTDYATTLSQLKQQASQSPTSSNP